MMQISSEVTVNANSVSCIRQVNNFGETVYMNICNNTSTVVPWGTMDWVGGAVLAILVLAFLAVLGWLLFTL